MKRLFVLLCLLPSLAACTAGYDYYSDYYYRETIPRVRVKTDYPFYPQRHYRKVPHHHYRHHHSDRPVIVVPARPHPIQPRVIVPAPRLHAHPSIAPAPRVHSYDSLNQKPAINGPAKPANRNTHGHD